MSCNRCAEKSAGPATEVGAPDVEATRSASTGGAEKCPKCGQFISPSGGHICPPVDTVKAGAVAGAPDVEANWSGNRDHPQFCSRCHGFLRADGGCTRCEGGITVSSDADPLAMAAAGSGSPMHLSCGHTKTTSVSPGSQDWCTDCDNWATVQSPVVVPTVTPQTTLIYPPDRWGPGRIQLWGVLEAEARGLGIVTAKNEWTAFAHSPRTSKAKGKVYGGFYGQGADGNWYSVVAHGPVGIAGVREVKQSPNEFLAREHYAKRHSRPGTGYTNHWPCDGSGRGVIPCRVCGALIAAGGACYNCDPKAARADAERAVEGTW